LQQVSAKTGSAARFLDAFWRRTFASNNLRYSSPKILSLGRGAYYNRATDTIHYDPSFLALQMRAAARQMSTDGDFAFIVILAHEWGHAVQNRLGLTRGRTIERELQADCLAGAFARAAREARLLDPGDLEEATFAFLMARDKIGTNPNDPYAHGSGDQRVRAFSRGLDGGARACGCF
jgi:predicted metalloprotease